MKSKALSCAVILAAALLTLGSPASAGVHAAKGATHSQVNRCDSGSKGHQKVNGPVFSACKAIPSTVLHHCSHGANVLLVKVSKNVYVLKQGHSPIKVNNATLLRTVASLCGGATKPRSVSTSTSTSPPTTTTTTTTTTVPVTVPATVPATIPATVPSTAAPVGCHPLTNGGNCYEPGEYCRDSDHGVTGVAGDGETITCENNNGWRWEPT
jgi:hypothetical protein